MDSSIFSYILRHSRRQQIVLLILSCLYLPLQYISVELPKTIIDDAIKAEGNAPYNVSLIGLDFSADLDLVTLLFVLCAGYLLTVLLSGGVKYALNVYRGRTGERMLRRLRFDLYASLLRFPRSHFRHVSQGELIPMITQEVEPMGGFCGTAFSEPVFSGGQLMVAIGFIMIQDWRLGVAAVALIPLQGYLIPRLQRKVNILNKERVKKVRKLAGHIGESVQGIDEIRGHHTANYELTRFTSGLGEIYWIRYEVFLRKFFIKFLNNFIDKLTPFFFLLIGGYYVLQNQLTLGALTGALLAYKDIAPHWKELLAWYQQKEDVRIKYEQVITQFMPEGMIEERLQTGLPSNDDQELEGALEVRSVSLEDDNGRSVIQNVSCDIGIAEHTAITGDSESGKSELAYIVARLLQPQRGDVFTGGHALKSLPESITGQQLGFIAQNAFLQEDSVLGSLVYGLKHQPVNDVAYEGLELEKRNKEKNEALQAGNVDFDVNADWVDLSQVGVTSKVELYEHISKVLSVVELEEDIYQIGLRGFSSVDEDPELASTVLQARHVLLERFSEACHQSLVETFAIDRFNENATVAENLFYGTPRTDMKTGNAVFDLNNLAAHPYVLEVLEKTGLYSEFLDIGEQVAETMIELFAGLPPGHEFFEKFSFIHSEELPEFEAILQQKKEAGILDESNTSRLLSLPFQIIPARHRLGVFNDTFQERILSARHYFAEHIPEEFKASVEFYDVTSYNSAESIQQNLLFGRILHGQANSTQKINTLVAEVVEAQDLYLKIVQVGLNSSIGLAGSRLSPAQRQKLAMARCLLRNPKLVIVDDALSVLDRASQQRIMEKVLNYREGQGVLWMTGDLGESQTFDRVLMMDNGVLASKGSDKLHSQTTATGVK